MMRLIMNPAPGNSQACFQGDILTFKLYPESGGVPNDWEARLRTTIGRGAAIRSEIFKSFKENRDPGVSIWRDTQMVWNSEGFWELTLPLPEVGYYEAKAYAITPEGYQVWPEGDNFGVSVHPDSFRTGNVIYCAFTRLFGDSKEKEYALDQNVEARNREMDASGYTVIPPSGTLRDLKKQVPHIFQKLGCRVLHLLPVHPTPTTFARMGRFGSPYAALDLTAIDPALVEFDQRTTGVDQFCELTQAVHQQGGVVFLDLVINHTGWGSKLQETHPEWFRRNPDGTFQSPGAWGVTWGDLVELDHHWRECWETLAQVFLTWLRRGVNGFRCDAGYMIPEQVWKYTIARVREYFPNAIFLLEGLGGPLETTENLLSAGGMNWAYSELFQNYTPQELHHYLQYSHNQSRKVGYYIHYSETHDNNRLAVSGPDHENSGRRWSQMRNLLCALTSEGGGFGFTSGVEWFAPEKINVHQCTGMRWGKEPNQVELLGKVNRLISGHPAFYDGATQKVLSGPENLIYAVRRDSADGQTSGLVAINTDIHNAQRWSLPKEEMAFLGESPKDWLQINECGKSAEWGIEHDTWVITLPPGYSVFLGSSRIGDTHILVNQPDDALHAPVPIGDTHILDLVGADYRRRRSVVAWALESAAEIWKPESIGNFDWHLLSGEIFKDPCAFLGCLGADALEGKDQFYFQNYQYEAEQNRYSPLLIWTSNDSNKVTPIPFRHWLVIEDDQPFQWELRPKSIPALGSLDSDRGMGGVRFGESIWVGENRYWATIWTQGLSTGEWTLSRTRFRSNGQVVEECSEIYICPDSWGGEGWNLKRMASRPLIEAPKVLLTNHRGGMARIGVAPGKVNSKYDCLLGANLNPDFPVDRHVLVKSARIWVNADGFISELDLNQVEAFESGPPARWVFEVPAGGGRFARIEMLAGMVPDKNSTILQWNWLGSHGESESFPKSIFAPNVLATDRMRSHKSPFQVSLTVRLDLEDRNFHCETHLNGEAEAHFARSVHGIDQEGIQVGFLFEPAVDRVLTAITEKGQFHLAPERLQGVPHPVEASRGQTGQGDGYSPGWFEIPLSLGMPTSFQVNAELDNKNSVPDWEAVKGFWGQIRSRGESLLEQAGRTGQSGFAAKLVRAMDAYVVRRDSGKTVIAGYPWFLDWGRDSLICARGLIAAGWIQEMRELIQVFARFEEHGTLPNTIHGTDLSNRNTSDAPLWLGVVCEEWLEATGDWGFLDEPLPAADGKTLKMALRSIGSGYLRGTPNGIRVDPESGLVWSPSHFTWMDTNYPAGTPREGYPIEIQALWERFLRFLQKIDPSGHEKISACHPMSWGEWADRVRQSVENGYWLESNGWYGDVLLAKEGVSAKGAVLDQALRSNFLLGITLGVLPAGQRTQRAVEAARAGLVIRGALRSLAPGRVEPPLEIRTSDGRLLNDPFHPYWGSYEGDEDTRRKPAYHNGTAWTWTFPVFCEALAKSWPGNDWAKSAARNYLETMGLLMDSGCIGQIPEVVDGDAPHCQRGCDAQAWGVTEAYRVWNWLDRS